MTREIRWILAPKESELWVDSGGDFLVKCVCGHEIHISCFDGEPETCAECGRVYRCISRLEIRQNKREDEQDQD